ncbi:hypothetical protein SAMN05444274_106152 [Mariniphaga anaerophila]|uniref:Uncharacterized protein n=1 Tax=Mariniphaga anaerophila TaxID=1484053 RepID=A0A1M5CJI6_9BACT|nr:hypothetical protein SAMN05444274_106152 [Mariniphaga anaerophila]
MFASSFLVKGMRKSKELKSSRKWLDIEKT